jgi:uncharacterized protein HemX
MFLLCCCIVLGLGVSVNTTTQQKHTETTKPNTIQQHNKNIQKRQNPIQYNNTTKTYRNAKTQYNTTTQQKHTETTKPNTIQQHNKNIQKRPNPIQYNVFCRFCMFLLCCCIVLGLGVSV